MQHSLQQYSVETFNKVLKYKGIKQTELADKLKYNRQRVWGYLTGKSEFTLQTFEAFCAALDIPCSKIFENYDRLEVPEKIVEEIPAGYAGKKDGLIETLKTERVILNQLIERLRDENNRLIVKIDKLEVEISENDIEIEKLKNKLK